VLSTSFPSLHWLFVLTPIHLEMVNWEQLQASVPRHDLPGRQLSLCVPQVQLELVGYYLLVYFSERKAASGPHSPSSQCLFSHT